MKIQDTRAWVELKVAKEKKILKAQKDRQL
jgi:hypothetical protein